MMSMCSHVCVCVLLVLCTATCGLAQTTFSVTTDMHQLNGVQMTFTNETACLSGCLADNDCLGVDFNFNDTTCFFHYTNTTCSSFVSKTGCISYRRIVCSSGMHAYGATVQMSYDTEQTCVSQCIQDSSCVSVDYNSGRPSGHRCFFHLNSTTGCSTLQANTAVNHYNSMRCTTTEMMTFVGMHGAGGVLTTVSPSNAYGCITACNANTACIAVDWENNGSTCWLHNTTTCAVTYTRASVTHFRIRACDAATTTTTTSTSTTTATTATTAVVGRR